MADVAAPAPAKSPKKKATKPKKPAAHPKYAEMIKAAIGSLKERGGSSRQAILKYILKNYKVGDNQTATNSHLKLALRAGVKNGSLKQSKGTGASGSFSIGKVAAEKKPKKVKKAKKPAAKKAKKPAAKKAKTPKKAAKPKKAKTPKKAAKKPAAKKPAAKKPAAKKPAAKKPAAKKAAKKPAAKKAAKK